MTPGIPLINICFITKHIFITTAFYLNIYYNYIYIYFLFVGPTERYRNTVYEVLGTIVNAFDMPLISQLCAAERL